jgi:hypothetical protein
MLQDKFDLSIKKYRESLSDFELNHVYTRDSRLSSFYNKKTTHFYSARQRQ